MNGDTVPALGDITLLHLCCVSLPLLPLFLSLWLSVARAKGLPGASELAHGTNVLLWCKTLPRPQAIAVKAVPVDVLCHIISLPDNASWEDPWGCSGSTKPVNTSLSSPLITDTVLTSMWISCGFHVDSPSEGPALLSQERRRAPYTTFNIKI